MGYGSSPRSLSPITGIWRPASPVECRWLSVSRRCAGPARTIANRFGPAAEPAVGVATADLSGETSQLAVHTPAGALPPNPARTHLRTSASGPLPQGRHRILSVTIVGLAPRVLSLTPQVVFSTQPDDAVFDASRHSDFIALPRSSPFPAPSNRIAQSAIIHPLFTPRLRRRNDLAAFCSSKTAGQWITTLARSNNFRSMTDCVRPQDPKPRTQGRHSASRLVSAIRTTFLCRVTDHCRSPPDFLVVITERNNPPRGSR
jgi:hypothetical protein